jgi:hypothetical protein
MTGWGFLLIVAAMIAGPSHGWAVVAFQVGLVLIVFGIAELLWRIMP